MTRTQFNDLKDVDRLLSVNQDGQLAGKQNRNITNYTTHLPKNIKLIPANRQN